MTQLALINSSMWLSVVVFEIPTGYIADIYGRKVSLIVSYLLQALGVLLFVIGTSVVVLVTSGIVWGIGITLSSGAETAWVFDEITFTVEDVTSNVEKGTIFNSWYSTFQAIGHLSRGIAQIVGGILASFAIWLPHSVIVGLFVFTAVLISNISEYRQPVVPQNNDIEKQSELDGSGIEILSIEDDRSKTTSTFKIITSEFQKPDVFIIAFLGIIMFSFIDVRYFMQLDFEQSGVPFYQIGIYFAIITLLTSFGSFMSSKLYQKLSSYLFMTIFVLIGILFNLMSVSTTYFVMILFGLVELSHGIFGPSYNTALNNKLESKYRATTLSIIGMVTKLVYIIFSIIFGIMVDMYSFSFGYSFIGIIFLITGLTLGYLQVRQFRRQD